MKKLQQRQILIILTLTAANCLLLILALKIGQIEISWSGLREIFSGTPDGTILRELRLARSLAAMIAGGAAALAGVILQKVLRNSLAAPDILGISSGAGLAGVGLLLLFPQWAEFLNGAAFAGALLTAALITLAAWKKGLSPIRLILAGVAISALFAALTGGLILFHADKLFPVMEFTLGGFSGKSLSDVTRILPLAAFLLILTLFLPRKLELLSLGELEATALGASVKSSRFLALTTAALAASLTVSLAGLLGFTGLMAPHIARKLANSSDSRNLLITAPLTGSALTLLGDLIGRTIFAPREIPAGLPISIAGAIFFLTLLSSSKKEME